MSKQAPHKAALYCRLSNEDDLQGESNSIVNQRRILESFAVENGFRDYVFFVDDGFSGANFERPQFSAMMERVRQHEFAAVYVKDLSRFGRDFTGVSRYMEEFNELDVTFQAVYDDVESDFAPLKNFFNEWYVRDCSRKVKAAVQAKGKTGKPITSQPVYGYLKDENGYYVIDPETAPVVQQIFALCLVGYGPSKIARILTEQQIPTPGTLEYQRTGSTRRYHPGFECKWATNTIVNLLKRREYLGCVVNFKTYKPSYKRHVSKPTPAEKQVVFEGMHEPIIDRDTWERVQELRKQRKRPNRYDDVGLFSGMLICADCGNILYQQRYKTAKREQDCYICGSYKKRVSVCTAHFIRTDRLKAGITANLREITSFAAEDKARFVQCLIDQGNQSSQEQIASARKRIQQIDKRIREIDHYAVPLYEQMIDGTITKELYKDLSARYAEERQILTEEITSLQAKLDSADSVVSNAESFAAVARKYANFDELTPTLLREMVKKIVVHEPVKDEAGNRVQQIDIYYTFVGNVQW